MPTGASTHVIDSFCGNSATTAWSYGTRESTCSYGLNGFMYDINDGSNNPSNFNGNDTPGDKSYWWGSTLDKVKTPTEVSFTADAMRPVGWPEHEDPAPPDGSGSIVNGAAGGSGNNTFVRFVLDRHPNTTINTSFVDGHSEPVAVPDLWRLKWSRKFEETSVDIPW